MNKGVVAFLAFTCGGVAGFFAGKKMLEQHYNQLIQEEIDSVKQAFRRRMKSALPKEKKATEKEKPVETSKSFDKQKAERKDYRAYYPESKTDSPKEEPKEEKNTKPYVIPPEEFDTIAGYEAISLTLYADGTVADDDDNAMSEEDIEETVSRESLKHFGEYEQDSVFVRNDDMRTDYEILLDERRYESVLKSKPYLNPKK